MPDPKRNSRTRSRIGFVLVVALLFGTATVAHADDDDWRGHRHGEHRGWVHHHHYDGYYVEPGYVYVAPAPVYVMPRPVYIAPPSLNIVIPLH